METWRSHIERGFWTELQPSRVRAVSESSAQVSACEVEDPDSPHCGLSTHDAPPRGAERSPWRGLWRRSRPADDGHSTANLRLQPLRPVAGAAVAAAAERARRTKTGRHPGHQQATRFELFEREPSWRREKCG